MAEGGSNWREQSGVKGKLLKNNLPPSKSPPQRPPPQGLGSRRRSQASGDLSCSCCSQGVNTQVLTINAPRSPPGLADNCGHREFGLKSGFVFKVTPVGQISDWTTSNAPGTWFFFSRGLQCYFLGHPVPASGSVFYLIWVMQPGSLSPVD